MTARGQTRQADPPGHFSWSLAYAPASQAYADVNGDSLYVHRSGPRVRAFTGRINGVVVTEGHRSLREAEIEVERIYVAGAEAGAIRWR